MGGCAKVGLLSTLFRLEEERVLAITASEQPPLNTTEVAPTPYTLHLTPYTLHAYTLNLKP